MCITVNTKNTHLLYLKYINYIMNKFNFFKKITSLVTVLSMTLGLAVIDAQFVYAAALTNISDTLSSVRALYPSNHSLVFNTPSGITANQTIQITFTGWSSLNFGTTSIDILVGNSTTTASSVNLNTSNGASQWGVSTSSNVLTLTAPSSGSLPTPGQVLIINIGTNAIYQASGTEQIANPAVGNYTATIAGNMADYGAFSIDIIQNDKVDVSGTVSQSISFSISTTTIYFGILSSGGAKYASSTNSAGDTASTTAHNLQVGTNAPYGYNVTIQGDTLRSLQNSSNVITAIGGTAAASNPGNSQFGIAVAVVGGTGAVVVSPYATTNQYGFNASTSTAQTLAYGNLPTDTTTYNLTYLTNITPLQAAGTYVTSLTYIGTANF